jgi:hypothetical protein
MGAYLEASRKRRGRVTLGTERSRRRSRHCTGRHRRSALGTDVAGLEFEALFGGFDREPLEDDSREYVFIAAE